MSGVPIAGDYIKGEGQSGRMGARLLAIVAEGIRERVYIDPTIEHEATALRARPNWKPDIDFFQQALGFRVGKYGMTKWSDLFTERQLVALNTFSDLVSELTPQVRRDAKVRLGDDGRALVEGGSGATAYAEAISTFLACAVSQITRYCSNLAKWNSINQNVGQVFGLQTIQMVWDFAEANVVANALGVIAGSNWVASALENVAATQAGLVRQEDARHQSTSLGKVVSTDPPYYDNVGYADLSDFFMSGFAVLSAQFFLNSSAL
jgi:putative DNA methylase